MSSRFVRVSAAASVCCGFAACSLPDDGGAEFSGNLWDGPGMPARVAFESPETETPPPELLPLPIDEESSDDLAPISSEPPVEPPLPLPATDPLPDVTPLVAENEFEKVWIPDFPLAPVPRSAGNGPALVSTAPGFKVKTPSPDEALPNDLATPAGKVAMQADENQVATEIAGPPAPESLVPQASLPYGIAVPGRPHLVRSPRAGELQLVDVSGMKPGDKVKCPFTGDMFLVPEGSKRTPVAPTASVSQQAAAKFTVPRMAPPMLGKADSSTEVESLEQP